MTIRTSIRNFFERLGSNKKIVLMYEITSILLSLAILGILLVEYLTTSSDKEYIKLLETFILIVFSIDYFIRLYIAEDKLFFIKDNIIDLIAIIPFNSVFQAARFTKIFKVLRILIFMVKLGKYIDKFIKTNNFHYVLWLTLATILFGALGMHLTEQRSFADSLWWSFVTVTTVGYGDISPSTPIARLIAVVLMITGIGFIGMLTGTIATYFIKKPEDDCSYKNEVIQTINAKLHDFDKLSNEDIKDICTILTALKEEQCKQSGT